MSQLVSAAEPLRDRLTNLLAEEGWRPLIERHFASRSLAVLSVSAGYVRVRLPEMALVGFSARISGVEEPRLGYVALLSPARLEQANGHLERRKRGRLAENITVAPHEGALVCVLPADRRVRGARTLLDATALKRSLHRTLEPMRAGRVRARARRIHIWPAAYKPERRLVCRLEVGVKCDTDGSSSKLALYGRAYADDRRSHFDETLALWHRRDLLPGVRLAEPLGIDPLESVTYSAEVEGTPFDVLGTDVARHAWRTAGVGLAQLHSLDLGLSRRFDRRPLLMRLHASVRALQFASSAAGARAAALSARMIGSFPEPERLVPIHGDFYAKQLLWDGDRVGIIDLDEIGCGDPAIDLANGLAHLLASEVRGTGAIPAAAARDAMLDGYGSAPRPEVFRWYLTWALLELAVGPFRGLEPEREERIAGLVDRAEQAWGGGLE